MQATVLILPMAGQISGNSDSVEVLLSSGADLDLSLQVGAGESGTPEELAHARGHQEVVTLIQAERGRRQETKGKSEHATFTFLFLLVL